MKKSKIWVAFVVASWCFACEREIAFNGGESEPMLVMNSILTPDAVVRAQLVESRFFLSSEDGFRQARGATVRLLKDGTEIETLTEVSGEAGTYTGTYRPQVGDRLQLAATAEGLAPVEGSTEIPPTPVIVSMEASRLAEEDADEHDVTVTIRDVGETVDYYRIALYVMTYDGKNGEYYREALSFTSNDLAFGTAGTDPLEGGENYYNVFPDELFNGKDYKLKLRVHYYYSGEWNVGKSLCAELQHITRDYYLYLKSRDAARGSEDMGGVFTEPVQIFNNIRGGIGILGSYTSTVYTLDLVGAME
jgi:hypothetical protein